MKEIAKKFRLSSGAEELLRIAYENDDRKAMADNIALKIALDFGQALNLACRDYPKGPSILLSLLDTPVLPDGFLSLTSRILQRIRRKQETCPIEAPGPFRNPTHSDFDRYVLQGFSHALADLIWPQRIARDFDGPPSELCISEIAKHTPGELWALTIKHYLANILQHYFSAARIREEIKDLPDDVEVELREKDAHRFAAELASSAKTDKDAESSESFIELFRKSLEDLIHE